eukprot:CAMPEP_0119303866 /NCGR_PEP_ID=MMETSP1333-20130426/5229_1 /TAXON_ID=418940 /ORGANISM="Scyphosphaera apsteinii, Strain RCC1455" /LENGTH=436 /DNA_ID=CAMNT_0007306637 /DNA_START=114 /DNA_END=1424 /DNA_ORIENTATION=+
MRNPWPFWRDFWLHILILFNCADTRVPATGAARMLVLRGASSSSRCMKPALALTRLDPQVAQLTWESMTELLTSCAIGYSATTIGLLNGAVIRALATAVFNIFLPSMLFTSVASTVAYSSSSTGSLLVIPLAAWVQVLVGLVVSAISLTLLRTPQSTPAGQGIIVLSAFGNSGVLPLIFINSLFRDAVNRAARQRAASLVAMYLVGWSPLFWTLGFAMLSGRALSSHSDDSVKGGRERAKRLASLRAGLQRALSPPILACLAGLVIGSTPPLSQLLLPSATGAPSPLPLYRCLDSFGKAYSPAALLVLAGSLAAPRAEQSPKLFELGHRFTHVVAISVARFVLVPLGSFGLIQASLWLGVLPVDPLRDFVLLLQSCMPSAQNAVLALQVDQKPEHAARMARMLLTIYLIATIPVAGTLSMLLQRYSSGMGVVGLST